MVRHKVQVIPQDFSFRDHNGKPALMSWQTTSASAIDLPELTPWVFYMTNPAIEPEHFDGFKFRRGIERNAKIHDCYASHYEFFFLPNATAEECAAHCGEEMAARGTFWTQIDEVAVAKKKASKPLSTPIKRYRGGGEDHQEMPGGPAEHPKHGAKYSNAGGEVGRLPGLVWPTHKFDLEEFGHYRSGVFIYPHADVNWEGDGAGNREVCLVQFNPVPVEVVEGDTLHFDPTQHPVRSKWMPAKGCDPGPSDMTALRWMDRHEICKWRMEAREATDNARELGWESW